MNLNKSKILKEFKKLVGHVNHFLITILVGLDGIKDGDITKNEEFSTSWNPRNKKASALRSRHFAISATLAWLVDSLDAYFIMCNEMPKLFQDIEMQNKFDGAGRSVYKKYLVFSELINIGNLEESFIDLIICWRNKIVHYNADNNILPQSEQQLLDNKDKILNNYCGLDSEIMLRNFKDKKVPTFKEITSLVRATINYVYKLDKYLLNSLDKNKYIDDIMKNYIKVDKIKRLDNIFSKDDATKLRKIQTLIKQNGFSSEKNEEIDNHIDQIANYNFNEAKEKFS